MTEALTIIEKNNLVELEGVIQKNLNAFYEVGFALMQIRDNKLYREVYGTFEEYCRDRWHFSKTHANRLISSAEVTDNLTPTGVIPQSERSIRPLTIIKDPEEQREIYQKAVETAPEGKVTARHVEETVRQLKHTETYPVTYAMKIAEIAISHLSGIREDDPEKLQALERVEDWIIAHK